MTTKKAAPKPVTSTPDMRREWKIELRAINLRRKSAERDFKRTTRNTTRAIAEAKRAVEIFERRVRRAEAAKVRGLMKELRILTQRAHILEGRLG